MHAATVDISCCAKGLTDTSVYRMVILCCTVEDLLASGNCLLSMAIICQLVHAALQLAACNYKSFIKLADLHDIFLKRGTACSGQSCFEESMPLSLHVTGLV